MKLSAPIYRLKRRAKVLARAERIPLHEGLDRVAIEEGFNGWSLLVARASDTVPSNELLARLDPGDLVLLGARPGNGKTMMCLELTIEAMKSGRRAVFFTLEYSKSDILNQFQSLGEDLEVFAQAIAHASSLQLGKYATCGAASSSNRLFEQHA